MKKLLLIIAIAIYGIANAQFSGGPKGGINFSVVSGFNDTTNQNNKIGFHFGAFGRYAFSNTLGVQVEMNYSMKGVKEDFISSQNSSMTGNSTLALNYLDIPVLFSYCPPAESDRGFFSNVGLQFSFLLSVKSATEITINGNSTSSSSTDKSGFNSSDLGLVATLGYKISAIDIGLRANVGLKDIRAEIPPPPDNISKTKNMVLQIYVGYNFGASSGKGHRRR